MMHVLIASSSAWFGHKQACLNIAERLPTSTAETAYTLVIDLATAQRDDQQASSDPFKQSLSMRSWIDHYFRDQPMLDVERVHQAARTICHKHASIEVIDATSLNADLIDRALNQLRVAFYGQTHWPRVLTLVVDDAILHDVAGFAGRVFFIQPTVTGPAGINSLLKNIEHFSRLEGVFGLRHRFLSSLNRWVSRIRHISITEEN